MTNLAVYGPDQALEVHLPKLIGCSVLKALPWPLSAGMGHVEPPIATEDFGDRARRRHPLHPEVFEPTLQLAPTPSRLLIAQAQDLRLHLGPDLIGMRSGTPTLLL